MERSWRAWMAIFAATHAQVVEVASLEEPDDLGRGRCGLAIASIAMMLEGYTNRHMEELIPEPLLESFRKLTVPQRYLLYPRLARDTKVGVSTWESEPVHESVKEIFGRRNRFVHGNLSKIDVDGLNGGVVVRLWHVALDVLGQLEIEWLTRIRPERHPDFRAEIDSYRIPSR